MDGATLNPYLFFNGNCKEAMEFYKSVFGGKLDIQTVGDMPAASAGEAEKKADKNNVMHARLESGGILIMASDYSAASQAAAKIELALGGEDEAKLRKVFDGLAEGGKVKMPLKKEYWGDIFGSLTDKYGIDWMVNIAVKKQ